MGKKSDINELVKLLSLALVHRIGGIVNPNEIYGEKYRKESDAFLRSAEKISLRQNWNRDDKIKIREFLKRRLKDGLEKRDFLDDKKFEIMDKEIDNVLKLLDLN